MPSRSPWILSACLALALVLCLWVQGSRIRSLEQRLGGGDSAATGVQADEPAQAGSPSSMTAAPLLPRLARLESEVAALHEQLGPRLSRRSAAGSYQLGPRAMASTTADPVTLIEALESDDPEVRDRFSSLLRDELQAQREERWEDRRQQRRERAEEMLDQLASDLGFSDSVRGDLSGLLDDERSTITALFQAAREDHSYGDARDKAREAREETDEAASELLTEEQYGAWSVQREEELARYYGRRRGH